MRRWHGGCSPAVVLSSLCRFVLLAACAAATAGCYESHRREGPPCTNVYFPLRGSLERAVDLDLLVMIDNSNSMAGEQALLGRELPRMFRALASGDLDEDGLSEVRPFRSIHVGVVTSDLGAGPVPPGMTVPSCRNGFGDDGILRTTSGSGADAVGCAPSHPAIFEYDGETTSAEVFAADVACVAHMGTGGCGFEQQLEAVLKAVAPSAASSLTAPDYVPPVFVAGGTSHGDRENAGFLRAGSVLALLLVTDEEDCSVTDYSIFWSDDRYRSVGLNLRCATFTEMLQPVDRYVDGLLAMRASPARLVFAVIAGVPPDLAGSTPAHYARMLADPRMEERPDPSATPPTRTLSSCETADGGEAFPPRRMVEVADGLARAGATTTVQSICAGDFRPAIERITTLLADPGGCVEREILIAPDGTSECTLFERLPAPGGLDPISTCAPLGLATAAVEVDDEGRHELCRVPAIRAADADEAGGSGVGWYHDVSASARTSCGSAGSGRVRLSGTLRATGATFVLSCPHRDVLEEGGTPPLAPLGAPCGERHEDGAVDCAATTVPSGADVDGDGAPDTLFCDSVSGTCAAPCDTDDDCELGGMHGYRCDLAAAARGLPRAICVHDTCF